MRDLEISKELLSEVLKLEVVKHSLFNKSNNSFNITYMQSEDSLKSSWMPINIYEFAFKCKIWVFNKYKIYLSSELGEDSDVSLFWTANFKIKKENKSFYGDTEFEAIIKACEWILKNKAND